MQGLVSFAGQIGNAIAILLPSFFYASALVAFLMAGWGFWRQAHPDNPFRGRPWVPFVSLLLSGVFSSFNRLLTMANASAGTALTVSIAPLTTYTPPTTTGVLGLGPGATVVNVVTLFQGFFPGVRRRGLFRRGVGMVGDRQGPQQPQSGRLRRTVRFRDHADQHPDDFNMAGCCFRGLTIFRFSFARRAGRLLLRGRSRPCIRRGRCRFSHS